MNRAGAFYANARTARGLALGLIGASTSRSSGCGMLRRDHCDAVIGLSRLLRAAAAVNLAGVGQNFTREICRAGYDGAITGVLTPNGAREEEGDNPGSGGDEFLAAAPAAAR
jgi:hypothetical protein